MNFLDQYQLCNQTLLPAQQQLKLSQTTQQSPQHSLLQTNPSNLLLSNILFPSVVNTSTSSASPSALLRKNDFTSQLSMAATQPNNSLNNAGISNQLICSQLEMLQQFQLSKQQDQQKEQYKLALISELLKLEQPSRQSVTQNTQIFDSLNPFLFGASSQLAQPSANTNIMNNVPSLIQAQQVQPITPQSAFGGLDILQHLVKQEQLPSSQQQQQQFFFQQPISQLSIDSQISLSQATSKANSPFGNVRSFGEEDQTMMHGAQQIYQKLEEVQVEPIKGTLRFPREFTCNDEEAEKLRADRLIKIEKFRNKRRNWLKKISYDCRKKVADSRLRVKGRFISKKDTQKIKELVGTSTQEAFNEKRNLRLDFMNNQMRENNLEIQNAVSKNEILSQIEKLLAKNKQIHTQHTMESVMNRIRNKQAVFQYIRRNAMPTKICEEDMQCDNEIESELSE